MSTDEIPQQPHLSVPESVPSSKEPITSVTDQTSNGQPEQKTNTPTDVIMTDTHVEVYASFANTLRNILLN